MLKMINNVEEEEENPIMLSVLQWYLISGCCFPRDFSNIIFSCKKVKSYSYLLVFSLQSIRCVSVSQSLYWMTETNQLGPALPSVYKLAQWQVCPVSPQWETSNTITTIITTSALSALWGKLIEWLNENIFYWYSGTNCIVVIGQSSWGCELSSNFPIIKLVPTLQSWHLHLIDGLSRLETGEVFYILVKFCYPCPASPHISFSTLERI